MKSNGFTIIEIIVVLVIAGVLAATAAPKFSNLFSNSPFSIDAATSLIESDIRYVQELAMATHQPKTMGFSQGSSSYYLPDSSEPRDLQGVTLDNNLTATFNSFGEPIAGGGQPLSVGGTKTVSITAYTGKVVVQ
ncbi:MAG TPA: prepilin-type N-terminal cleavage/methylation domain-containing protein [Candidatus Brocadiales bacterium]|nr:prepilin-type N-terminal cleavage/methylation domain-containing protein [Candidatus Brocadiales bacterium]